MKSFRFVIVFRITATQPRFRVMSCSPSQSPLRVSACYSISTLGAPVPVLSSLFFQVAEEEEDSEERRDEEGDSEDVGIFV